MHALLSISLFPFVTAWLSENHFVSAPSRCIASSRCSRRLGRVRMLLRWDDTNAKVSMALYALALAPAFFNSWIACALYVAVALIWLAPDRRMEKVVTS